MSDAELRDLERAWAQSGSRADALAYLRAARAAGVLSEQQLELAAYLGYRPVLDLLERPDPIGVPYSDSSSYGGRLCDWLEGLETFGEGICVRAGLALARACTFPNQDPRPPFPELVEAFARWVEDPGEATAAACEAAAEALRPARLPPSMGLFASVTGQSDEDDVHDAMDAWEKENGVSIYQLQLQESVFKTAEALARVTTAEDPVKAVSWFNNIRGCQSPSLRCELTEVVPAALLAELGFGERIPADDLANPCPYRAPGYTAPVQSYGRRPVAEPYETLPKDKPKLDLSDKPILRSRREGGFWGLLKGLFGS